MTTPNKPSVGFWIIAVIALLWNLMGVYQYLAMTLMKEEMAEAMTEAQVALVTGQPAWFTGVFAIAVFAGILACILLLMKKKWAVSLFLISMLAVIVQMGYWLFATDVMEVYELAEAVTMPILVVIVAIFLYFYSKGAAKKGWLS